MSFDWTGYLRLAISLLEGREIAATDYETRARCAIGRAYYAVAMTAREQMALRGVEFSRSGIVHQEIGAYFYRSDQGSARYLARQLRKLRVLRNQADYDASFLAGPVAREAVHEASVCLELLREIL